MTLTVGYVNIWDSHDLSVKLHHSGTCQHQGLTSLVSKAVSHVNISQAILQWYLQHHGLTLAVSQAISHVNIIQALSPWYLQHQGVTLPVSQAISQ